MPDTEHGQDRDESEGPAVGRRRFVQGVGAVAALAAGLGAETAGAQDGELSPAGALLADAPDNWGRWGEDDELGALNLLGSAEMVAGMEAALQGGAGNVERFTLQTPITGDAVDALVGEGEFPTTDTGDPAFPGRLPARRDNDADWRDADSFAGMRFADDRFDAPLYLQGTTHADALGHGFFADGDANGDGTVDRTDEQLYNGFSAETTATRRTYDVPVPGLVPGEEEGTQEVGAIGEVRELSRADISNAATAGVQGRGVLLDVGRHLGDEENGWLDLGQPVGLADLQDTADAQGVEIRERDVLLVRTGAIERVRDPEAPWHAQGEPGLTYSDQLVRWVADMDIPYIGADNLPVEAVQSEVTEDDLADGREDLAGTYVLPLHGAFLRNLGVTLNELLDLSDLAAACAEDGVYEFLFTAAPLHVVGGTGAPINPVVTKATAAGDGGEGGGDGGGGGGGDGGGDGSDGDGGSMEETEMGAGEDTEMQQAGDEATTEGGSNDGLGVVGGVAGVAGVAGARLYRERSGGEE